MSIDTGEMEAKAPATGLPRPPRPPAAGGPGCLVKLALGLFLAFLFTSCGAGVALTLERIWKH